MRIKMMAGVLAGILGLSPLGQAQTSFMTNGLLAYYPFGGNANDESGNENHGTILRNAAFVVDRNGQPSSALLCTNNLDWGNVATTVEQVAPENFSLSLWFKVPPRATAFFVWFNKAQSEFSSPVTYDRILGIVEGKLDFYLFPNVRVHLSASPVVDDGAWHSVVATLSSSEGMRIFVDGSVVASNSAVTTGFSYSGWWRLGGLNARAWESRIIPGGAVPNILIGIDEVRIYGRALSDQEVRNLYAYEFHTRPWVGVKLKTVELTLHVRPTSKYQLQSSLDLTTWADLGAFFVATTSEVVQEVSAVEVGRYFRLLEVP